MKKREAEFGKQFRSWLTLQHFPCAAFELKQTITNAIRFDALKEHQENALFAAISSGILYKAPDDSRGVKPFDFFYLRGAKAYVVIKYPSGFVVINIYNFIGERERSTGKSLSWERAQEIADHVIER
jgi:hypothetical protein